MASNALIVANENIFNKSILGNDAFYFQNVNEVEKSLEKKKKDHFSLVENNKSKITKNYTWETINGQYEKFLMQCLRN